MKMCDFQGYFCNFQANNATSAQHWQMLQDNYLIAAHNLSYTC